VFGEFGKTLVGDMPFDNLEVDIAVYAKQILDGAKC
jgi:hypothetical protein